MAGITLEDVATSRRVALVIAQVRGHLGVQHNHTAFHAISGVPPRFVPKSVPNCRLAGPV
jgi:hypothetical protein